MVVAPASLDAATPINKVLLSDPGAGFTLVDETPGNAGSLTRTYQADHANLILNGFPITDPPGVGTMFQVFSGASSDFSVVDEPSFALAKWFVPAGTTLGNGFASLVFASEHDIFVFTMTVDAASGIEPLSFVRDLARRQIEAAGGPPTDATKKASQPAEGDSELIALLPTDVPPEFGLNTSATVSGNDELTAAEGVQAGIADFLNKHSRTVARVWTDDTGDLQAAVSVTKYPYDIFAAASVDHAKHSDSAEVTSTDALDDVPDVVSYVGRGDNADQIGTAFRRGDLFVLVLATHKGNATTEQAAALVASLTRATSALLPSGETSVYQVPSTPSKVAGLALSAALVTAAASGSTAVGRLRARRAARRWRGGPLPPPAPAVNGVEQSMAIALDGPAKRLRHQGAIITGGQLATVNVSIVALAGDFAWPGVAVAAAALIAGLLLTHWWQHRELGLLGAAAPPRQFILPRPIGAVVGLLALAVLGAGVGFAFKGLRYLVLPITPAQLKWSDLLGIAARTVGVVFCIGGFLVAVLGGWLFRLARAFGRSGTRRVLSIDHRRAALYLRSFEDDSVPLPTIASARRPLFELFSVRGTDPFEESVAWELNSYGPVVAVGRPGRSLASLGAAREHLSDATWRDQVAIRMDEAAIIAIAIGETDGLAWELGHVVARGHLPKTFFVFPPVAPAAIGERWQHTAASLIGAGQAVGPLPVPPALVHTVRVNPDGTTKVTFANRRDEATYRTAVDLTLEPVPPNTDVLAPPVLLPDA